MRNAGFRLYRRHACEVNSNPSTRSHSNKLIFILMKQYRRPRASQSVEGARCFPDPPCPMSIGLLPPPATLRGVHHVVRDSVPYPLFTSEIKYKVFAPSSFLAGHYVCSAPRTRSCRRRSQSAARAYGVRTHASAPRPAASISNRRVVAGAGATTGVKTDEGPGFPPSDGQPDPDGIKKGCGPSLGRASWSPGSCRLPPCHRRCQFGSRCGCVAVAACKAQYVKHPWRDALPECMTVSAPSESSPSAPRA
ncbi:hypothetical protein BV25DRAFT_1569212 [Artomyces pyxidatus]|uniref:Uncharacterized protein n=1 Tax=Artomyces pyxidatus TaxID=48021 RepID=A0ACB8SK64_9AGAM|nr:hypothetical protein BV25DRAFT_1569212 [Artomyces pyxidatus]